jgi:hypothetical protein
MLIDSQTTRDPIPLQPRRAQTCEHQNIAIHNPPINWPPICQLHVKETSTGSALALKLVHPNTMQTDR